jgi:sugar O-acyltransferase (sialic acid O-acetyltransferase NeuD family)
MKNIAIFGAGGLGREVQMLIEQINLISKEWNFIGFFDDGMQEGILVNESPVLGGINELNNWTNDSLAVVFAIGNPQVKKKIISKINNPKLFYPVLIHPNVQIGSSKFVEIGEGTIIAASNIITVNISIGRHVLLNKACIVAHDTVICDYSSVMSSVNISGEVKIGECVYIGVGAKIINKIEIGNNTIVGAGAVVTKSLPANCTAIGIPAKPIKFH